MMLACTRWTDTADQEHQVAVEHYNQTLASASAFLVCMSHFFTSFVYPSKMPV
jgi:hypothetical protein